MARKQEEVAAKLRRYEPNDYIAHLVAAQAAFGSGDIQTARNEIAQCRGVNDATWRYSEAFLNGYEGDLEEAYRSYRAALASPLKDASVPTQCEDFIMAVLEKEPERT